MFLIWAGIFAVLLLFFSIWQNKQENPNQSLNKQYANGTPTVTLMRNRSGHYVASGYINNHPVTFLLDTGATSVVIPAKLAKKLQLTKGVSQYATTANGTITTYATRLRSLQLGAISLHSISASINPSMEGKQILLGMSALRQLQFTQRGNQLTLMQVND